MFIPSYSQNQMFYSHCEYKTARIKPNYVSKDAFSHKLYPLRQDTISFGACKKMEFEGIDYAVVERFNAPIEKFNSTEDLQNWAKKEVEKIRQKDFGGRQQETQIQRKETLKEWEKYVCEENDAYTPTMRLLILNSITKDLKPKEDKLPPVLNKGALADTVNTLHKRLKEDPKCQFNFSKIYQTKLNALYLETEGSGTDFTGWVKIPSKQNDLKNFEVNVDKLKTLSHKNWCTKSYNAEPYLENGDFHVYLENGKPKLGVRFVGDEIQEIQGEKNNGIPIKYLDIAEQHIKDNKFGLKYNAQYQIVSARNFKDRINKTKADLGDAIKNNDTKTILEYFGMECEELPDGMLRIFHYNPIFGEGSFSDLGINENKLFENIKEITFLGDFRGSNATDLGKLERIGGPAIFANSQITSLGELKEICGSAYFERSNVTDLGKLQEIGEDAWFSSYQKISLKGLKKIKGRVIVI